jgi:hypothetical protein
MVGLTKPMSELEKQLKKLKGVKLVETNSITGRLIQIHLILAPLLNIPFHLMNKLS